MSIANEIIEGLNDAIHHAEGKNSNVVVHHALDVAALRHDLELSQSEFSKVYNIPVATLQKWETGTRTPQGATRAYLSVIKKHPEIVKNALL
jgi:putative transcriptional regulator